MKEITLVYKGQYEEEVIFTCFNYTGYYYAKIEDDRRILNIRRRERYVKTQNNNISSFSNYLTLVANDDKN